MIESESKNTISAILDEDEQTGWMVTYADLVTLLLVFFILLFSISSLNLEKFRVAVRSIQVNLGEANPPIGLIELLDLPEAGEQSVSIEDVTGLHSREQSMIDEIYDIIDKKQLDDHILLTTAKGKVMLQIQGQVLFNSGSAELNPGAMPILDDIVKIIEEYTEYTINIKGHTDNIPISTTEFPSNWELSSIRATHVLKYLIHGGISPSRLTATGYGSSMPIAPNDTEKNRAKNRRVEFVLEKKTTPF